MPSIFKALSRSKAEPYRFPSSAELATEPPPEPAQAKASQSEPEAPPEAPIPNEKSDPIGYAQYQAEQIVADARREAEQMISDAAAQAEERTQEIYNTARREGYETGMSEGLAQGLSQAMKDAAEAREAQAAAMQKEIERWLDRAGHALDRQLDDNVEELRDLAIAIAEKVVSVSLKSSTEVIGKMIQTAVDKRKRREWAHIYIAESDAKRLVPVPASLTTALAALSDRVRIIPMADDEPGTCIIELPDEIVDASASTQLNNIRTMLSDAPIGTQDMLFR